MDRALLFAMPRLPSACHGPPSSSTARLVAVLAGFGHAATRAATRAARAPPLPAAADPLAILRDEEEADSDEEWEGIKARAAARHEVKTAPQQQQRQQQQRKRAADDEERPEEDHAERSDKASGRGSCAVQLPCSALLTEQSVMGVLLRNQHLSMKRGVRKLVRAWVGWERPQPGPSPRASSVLWGRKRAATAVRAPATALPHPLSAPWANSSCLQGEDWEHEDVAADDDLDMGESQEEEVVGSPARRWAGRRACSAPGLIAA